MQFLIELRDAPSDAVLSDFSANMPLPVPDRGDRIEFTAHVKTAEGVTTQLHAGRIERRTFAYTPVQVDAPPGVPVRGAESGKVWTMQQKVTLWLDPSS